MEIGRFSNQLAKQARAIDAERAPARYVPPTITQQLEMRKQQLEQQLAEVNEALSAVAKNPEVETVLNLLAKI